MNNNIFFGPLDGRRPSRFRRQTIAFQTIGDSQWNVGTVGAHIIIARDGSAIPFDAVTQFVPLDNL